MNNATTLFYKNRNIDTTKPSLEMSDIIIIANELVKNINFANLDVLQFLDTLDKNYPSKTYFSKALKAKFNINSVISLKYWEQRGFSESESLKYATEQRKLRISNSSVEYWLRKGYSEEESKRLASEEQRRRSKTAYANATPIQRKQRSIRSVEHWLKKGLSEEEANKKVFDIQSEYGKRNAGKIPPEKQNTRIEYYLNLGYSESEAKEQLKDRQTTFSLKKCIEKFGEDTGRIIWENRQAVWQETLNSKTPEEIEAINFKKSNKDCFSYLESMRDRDGAFYILKLSDTIIKIGITTKATIEERYSYTKLIGIETILFKNCTLYEAFLYEQFFKNYLKNNKIKKKDKIATFGWTESFTIEENTISQMLNMLSNEIEYFENSFSTNEDFIYGMGIQERKNI